MSRTLTRRRVLAAAAVAALPAGRAAAAAGLDVIIVGGGVAGLNTAWLLEQQGLRVQVLEGRKRVGGRVFTLFDEPGLPEMGFNVMGAGYARGLAAAQRTGMKLVNLTPAFMAMQPSELVLAGKIISKTDWPSHPVNPFPASMRKMMPWEIVGPLVSKGNGLKNYLDWTKPEYAKLDIPMHDFLSAAGLDDASIDLAFNTQTYYGTNSYDVSALMYEFNDGWIKAQAAMGIASWAVKGGNMRLPMAMAAQLKSEVLLGKRVASVASDASSATVMCDDGSRYQAKRVVMAVPFSVMRDIGFDPVLRGLQARAVQTLPYQPVSLLFLRVTSPFWETDKLSPSMWSNGPFGTVMAQQFNGAPGEVTGLVVEARAELAHEWDRMGPAAVKAMVVAQIETLRPAARGKLEPRYLQSWAADPFNAGDWSYWSPGQISLFANVMAAPAGRIHFAGEHTSLSERGLEAAFESSERVAVEVLEA